MAETSIEAKITELWDYSNPQETRKRFESLLGTMEPSGEGFLQLKTQIARTHSLSGEFSEAHQVLDAVAMDLDDDTPVARVRYMLERGRTWNSSGETAKATDVFQEAYLYGREIQAHAYAVDAAHMIGISSETLEGKLEWNQKGLNEAKESKDEDVRRWIGVFHNNMGWDLFEVARYSEALAEFEKSRDFYRETQKMDRLAIAQWSIAKAYRFLERICEALEIQNQLLENHPDGYVYEELGELYLKRGETQMSQEFFGKAYIELSKDTWLQKNEAERLNRIQQLSRST